MNARVNMVILSDQQGKRWLPIFVESAQADAIVLALPDNRATRPYPYDYDLLCLIIEACFSARVSTAIIHDTSLSRDKLTFDATILLTTNNDEQFKVVCCAPDAIAIAARTQAPIFVEESLMERAALLIDTISPEAGTDSQKAVEEQGPSGVEPEKFSVPIEPNRVLSPRELEWTGQKVEVAVADIFGDSWTLLPPIFAGLVLSDKADNWRLTVIMEPRQAQAISRVIHNVALPEPHNLLCKIVKVFSSKVSMVIIHGIRDNVFRAQLVLETKDRRFGVECRPSDAIAVALTAKAAIFATESFLHKAGTSRTQIAERAATEALLKTVTMTPEDYLTKKRRANQQQIEALVSVIKAPSWKFWISKDKKAAAGDTLAHMAADSPDPYIRQMAAWAIERTHPYCF